MSKPEPITMDEWLNELARCAGKSAEGMTAKEIAAKLGKTDNWVREKLLAPLKMAGRLSQGKASREQINGIQRMTDVYRILPAKRK